LKTRNSGTDNKEKAQLSLPGANMAGLSENAVPESLIRIHLIEKYFHSLPGLSHRKIFMYYLYEFAFKYFSKFDFKF
jgi:hypothetical protein